MPDLVMTEPQPFLFLEYHASAVALSTIERDFTYADTLAYASAIAGLLRRRGVRPGQVVVARLRNDLNLFFMEAVFHEAAIWCTAPAAIGVSHLAKFEWLLTHDPTASFASERTIVVDDAFMAEVARAEHRDLPLVYDDFDSVCRISFSSGTTGTPVAVPSTVTHQGRSAIGWLDSRPFFSLIQGFSGSGVKAACTSVFLGDTYICPGEPDDNVTLAQRNFVSTLQGSPAQIAEFLDLLERRDDRHTDITTVQYIGSFLSQRLLDRIRSDLGASVTACYGSSEVGMIAMRTGVVDNPADVGVPLPHFTVEIVDEDDRALPNGVDGVVRVRSSRRKAAYFRSEENERSALREGWFYPGDLGRLTVEGHLVLAGRSAEVINAAGVKFNAALLDEFLVTQQGVRDGAIIAFPDADGLPGYAALVVVDDAFDLASLVEPLRVASGGMAPASIIRIGNIARDENGKVPRVSLAETVRAAMAGELPQ